MVSVPEKHLRSVVNASGFVFQVGVADLIQRSESKAGWRLASFEHGWSAGGSEGYIDLVLEALSKWGVRLVMTVECKRHAAPAWVFQVANTTRSESARARCLFAEVRPRDDDFSVKEIRSGWGDFLLAPNSPEALFCSIQGEGGKREMMIERLAGELLAATEALCQEEICLTRARDSISRQSIYVPAIVTTAPLAVCRFDASSVSMRDGKLPADAGDFTWAPVVRFRKSLAATATGDARRGGASNALAASNADRERTVLVINSSTLLETLSAISSTEHPWP